MTEWNAAAYDRVAHPQARWGAAVLERLPLDGGETVLLGRLPSGRVVALDASGAMLPEAQRRLARYGDRVSFVEADLGRSLPIEPVDAILDGDLPLGARPGRALCESRRRPEARRLARRSMRRRGQRRAVPRGGPSNRPELRAARQLPIT